VMWPPQTQRVMEQACLLGNSSQEMPAQTVAPVDIDVKGARKLVKASTASKETLKNKSEMSARSKNERKRQE